MYVPVHTVGEHTCTDAYAHANVCVAARVVYVVSSSEALRRVYEARSLT